MIFFDDATATAAKIRKGEYTVSALTNEVIATIRAENKMLNAVTDLQQAAAMQVAERADKMLARLSAQARADLPPFFGVPILLKDLGDAQKGMPLTNGSRLMRSHVAAGTDRYVQALLQAGFLIVGRTNAPEFGVKTISDAEVYGPVASPLDLARNPGGSSGGAAAAVKAGWVPLASASDGGGSIRVPAGLNGLIGLKPTRGRTPAGPGNYRRWQGAAISFALTKTVRDTMTLLTTVQERSLSYPFPLPPLAMAPDQLVNRRPLKIAWSAENPVGEETSAEAKTALAQAVSILSDLGHHLEEKTLPTDGIAALKAYYLVNAVEMAANIDSIGQMLRRPVTKKDLEATTWAWYRAGFKVSGLDYTRALQVWDHCSITIESFLEDYDLYLTPTTNEPAPIQNRFALSPAMTDKLYAIDDLPFAKQQALIWEAFADLLAYAPFTQQANIGGQPAISLPLYENEAGLPLGLQFMGKKGAEPLLLALAQQLEAAGALTVTVAPLL